MSLYSDLNEVLTPYANKIKELVANLGNLSNLETTDKSSIVAAINEAARSGGTEIIIDNTLTQSGQAADAKAAGDAISQLSADLWDNIESVYSIEKRIQYTLNSGFIGGTGNISSAGETTKEVYTNLIPVSSAETLSYALRWAESNAQWIALAEYDSNQDFIRRISVASPTTAQYDGTYTQSGNAAYISLTYRTYGSASLNITTTWDALSEKINAIINEKPSAIITTRNIFNGIWEHAYYTNDGVYTNTTSQKYAGVNPDISVTGGQTYTFSWGANTIGGGTIYIHEFDSSKTRLIKTSAVYANHSKSITLQSNTAYIGLEIYYNNATAWTDIIPAYFQIEIGNVATEYIPHLALNLEMLDDVGLENIVAHNLPSNTIRSIAHRGDCVLAPQCTAPAYILARKRGYSIAENDLWLSSDGKFVMWHDTSLSRLGINLFDINGYYMYTDGTDYYWYDSENTTLYTYDSTNGYVASAVSIGTLTQCKGADYSVTTLPLAVLKRLDFGAYKGDKYKGTQILTLAEWVLLCKQLGMEIYIDRKLTYTDALLTEAANIVNRLGMGGKSSWIGLLTTQITTLRTIIDDARCGILQHPSSSNVASLASYNTGRGIFFDGDESTATAEAIQIGLDAGFEVECYYVGTASVAKENQFARIRELIGMGITGFTLDHYKAEEASDYLLDQY